MMLIITVYEMVIALRTLCIKMISKKNRQILEETKRFISKDIVLKQTQTQSNCYFNILIYFPCFLYFV